jgi:hypothetical protein
VASALVAADGRVHAVVAVPVLMPNPAHTPVLLLTQPFESQVLGQIAERTGEAVVLSDGKSALVGAGRRRRPPCCARPSAGAHRAPDRCPADGRTAVATSEVAPGLWLLGHVNTETAVTRATALFTVLRVGVGVIGGALFLLLLWSARRPSRTEREQAVAPIPPRRPRSRAAAATCCCNGWAAAAWPRSTWRWPSASAGSAAPAWSSGCAPS